MQFCCNIRAYFILLLCTVRIVMGILPILLPRKYFLRIIGNANQRMHSNISQFRKFIDFSSVGCIVGCIGFHKIHCYNIPIVLCRKIIRLILKYYGSKRTSLRKINIYCIASRSSSQNFLRFMCHREIILHTFPI